MKKKNSFLTYYAGIILALLIIVMFIIPDSFFLKLNDIFNKQEITLKESTTTINFKDLSIQKESLLTGDYEYEYLMLDSMGETPITYECLGKIENGKESGTCTSPKTFNYTNENKNILFSQINTDYIDLNYIFNLIKDIKPKELTYTKARELTYNVKILDLNTEITLYTDLDNINQINISNAYMTYVFKYNHNKV